MPSDHEAIDSTDSAGFACALCNKTFVRRDLRNRHRRRCEKSIGKVRVSKKRSCEACGKSKLRCDLQMPSCSRCITRQVPCQYPPETLAAAAQNAGHESITGPFMHDLSLLTDDMATATTHHSISSTPTGSLPNLYPPIPLPIPANTSAFDPTVDDVILENMMLDGDGFSRSNSDFWDHSTSGLLPGDVSSIPDSYMSSCSLPASYPMSVSGSMHEEAFFGPSITEPMHFGGSSDLLSPNHLPFASPSGPPRSSTNDTSSYANSMFSLETGSTTSPDSSFADMGGLFMKHRSGSRPVLQLTTPTAHPSPKTVVQPLSPDSPPTASPAELYRDSGAASLPTPSHSRPGSISSLDQLSLALQSSYRTWFSVEEAATILCDYPTEMLDKTYKSPFLHQKAHHSSEPGLPEPIAVALCCVSANTHSVESSVPFVCKMIEQQCEKLIHEFPTRQMNLEDSWAFLHALCIYQIESMLAMRKQRPRDCIMSAELHHAFLLKMARSAAKSNSALLKTIDNDKMDWRMWTLVETLRRNIFLVNMINDLSFATKALNGHYYEPLEDEYIADLPLPAPESVWKARTLQEWAAARDSTNWSNKGIMTLGQAVQKLHLQEDLGELEPLQKLVVSCAWRRVSV